ncbi:MAG: c-type cytochrome [Candidatus Obscuribacterales bacterium]|nr:c-type cytochrome [Steroidobacteraceae bacterium]
MKRRYILLTVCAVISACARGPIYEPHIENGDARNGQRVLQQYECGVCHSIPGVRSARGQVGPSLAAYRRNVYVAGKYPNTPEYLIAWIMDAPALAPHTAMPAMGVTAGEARDIAAYLYTLK